MKSTGVYPSVRVDAAGRGVVSQAGGLLLVETARASGLDRLLTDALAPWTAPTVVHQAGKVACDLATSLAAGGDSIEKHYNAAAKPFDWKFTCTASTSF